MDYLNVSTVEFRSNIYPADRDPADIAKQYNRKHPMRCAYNKLEGYLPIGEVYNPRVLPNGMQKKRFSEAIKCTYTACSKFEECKKLWIGYSDEEFAMLSDEGTDKVPEPPEIIEFGPILAKEDAQDQATDCKNENDMGEEIKIGEPEKPVDPTVDENEEAVGSCQSKADNKDCEQKMPIDEGGSSMGYEWAKDIDLFEWYYNNLTDSQIVGILDNEKITIPGFRDKLKCVKSEVGKKFAKQSIKSKLKPPSAVTDLDFYKNLTPKAKFDAAILSALLFKIRLDIIDQLIDMSDIKPRPITIETLQAQIEILNKRLDEINVKFQEKQGIINEKERIIKEKEALIVSLEKSLGEKDKKYEKDIKSLEKTVSEKDLIIAALEADKKHSDLLIGLTRNVLLFNMKATENFHVPYNCSSISYASISDEKLPEGAFTELWYVEGDDESFSFWSSIEKLQEVYEGFGIIALSKTQIDELGLEVL